MLTECVIFTVRGLGLVGDLSQDRIILVRIIRVVPALYILLWLFLLCSVLGLAGSSIVQCARGVLKMDVNSHIGRYVDVRSMCRVLYSQASTVLA